MGFDFNAPSFGIGFGAGIVSTVAGYQVRRWLQRRRESLPVDVMTAEESGGRDQRSYAARHGDRRYLHQLVRSAQAAHLAGHRIALTEILVEPRFVLPEPVVMSAEQAEDEEPPLFDEILPPVYDFPYLRAPYNIPTLSIADLGRARQAVAILGEPGSGRTTALMTIALWSMDQVAFTPPPDVVQERIEAEESRLTAEERAKRVQRRVEGAQAARERIARQKAGQEAVELLEEQEKSARIPAFKQLVPVYVHLNNVIVRRGGYGSSVDPAEPLVRAVQAHVGWLASRTIPRGLYRLLNSGKGLILLDGLDEVPEAEQAEKWAWLKAFREIYGANFIVMTAPVTGYQPAVRLGFLPVYLRPWSDTDIARSVSLWAQHWTTISGQSKFPGETLVERMRQENRARPPFELALRLWAEYAGDGGGTPGDHVNRYLHHLLKNADAWQANLQRMAALQLDEGFITLSRLVTLEMEAPIGIPGKKPAAKATAAATVAAADTESTDNTDDAEDEFEKAVATDEGNQAENKFEKLISQKAPAVDTETNVDVEAEAMPKVREDRTTARVRQRITAEQRTAIETFLKAGLLVRYRGQRYRFRHHFLASYLAGLSLIEASDDALTDRTQRPAWREALAYASQHREMDAAMRKLLELSGDVLHTGLLELTRWLKFAGIKTTWRTKLLQYLGTLFVAPNQFSLVRERIAAALVSSQDEGALTIFRRALQDGNPDVRKLCCLGLGALRDSGSIMSLRTIMQNSGEYDDVQIAAAMALAAIGTEDALMILADELQVAPVRNVRRAIAEMFAALPETGYPMLYDAINTDGKDDDSIILRRAALFGLGRIQTPWALIALNEVFLNGAEEYAVRSAAEYVLDQLYLVNRMSLQGYPSAGNVPWLRDWYAQQSRLGAVADNMSGEPLLMFAFEQNIDAETRRLAAETLGQIGIITATPKLYDALIDPQAQIRDAAYRSLGRIQVRTGKPLPAVV